ncbi:MAG TPA: rRNA maturation RNase YbeY [Myxococcales bacterium]|nr:rRNA maturation RNase YbeY [Myxococcales bacterium]
MKRGDYAARVLRKAAGEWLRDLRHDEVSLSLVGDREMRALNRQWRGKDQTTDVLSFPMEETGRAPGRGALAAGRHLGDVVISLPVARRQAREGGWPLAMELRRLLAHGLLHCAGHDHEKPADAERMRRAERKLLGARGMV